MENNEIRANDLAKAFLAGAKYLEAKKDLINELNVFPVPDGDTGTNMTMTIMSAATEVAAIENPDMKTVSKAMSSGSLRGARGNSGVILSQLFRGFTKVIKNEEILNVNILNEAFQKACETAYKAVMKPKEGTILTVARGAADKAAELAETTDDILEFSLGILEEAEAVLAKTPDMLPVLKQAGVVDSGGQGLVEVFRGICDYLSGKEIDLTIDGDTTKEEKKAKEIKESQKTFTYSMSFSIIAKDSFAAKLDGDLKEYFNTIGKCIDIELNGKEMKASLFTDDPGKALSRSIKFGILDNINIKNIKLEKTDTAGEPEEKAEESLPAKNMGFVAVSIGEGMNRIFHELGADYIIEGGQTMNPSTEDIISAIDKVNAKTVFVLPNNKNIILAANQAKDLCDNKEVIVLPTKTLPQGVTALINFIADQSVSENEERMTEEIKNVKSGEITYAVRDTIIDDKEIKEGDYMGIGDSGILAVNKDIEETFTALLEELIDEDSSLVSIYFGSDVSESDAEALKDKAATIFPDIEFELQMGGQPVYYYVISVE
ncbi:MAG: DAK2 domain-containing protein [Lachnospiraceae bacterium]|nr:DAK2 domain-containing protein [Lachnospiraceae bacterium]